MTYIAELWLATILDVDAAVGIAGASSEIEEKKSGTGVCAAKIFSAKKP